MVPFIDPVPKRGSFQAGDMILFILPLFLLVITLINLYRHVAYDRRLSHQGKIIQGEVVSR